MAGAHYNPVEQVFEAADVGLQTTNLEPPGCHTVRARGRASNRRTEVCSSLSPQAHAGLKVPLARTCVRLFFAPRVDNVTGFGYHLFYFSESGGDLWKEKNRSLISGLLCEFIPEHSSNIPQKSQSKGYKRGGGLVSFLQHCGEW